MILQVGAHLCTREWVKYYPSRTPFVQSSHLSSKKWVAFPTIEGRVHDSEMDHIAIGSPLFLGDIFLFFFWGGTKSDFHYHQNLGFRGLCLANKNLLNRFHWMKKQTAPSHSVILTPRHMKKKINLQRVDHFNISKDFLSCCFKIRFSPPVRWGLFDFMLAVSLLRFLLLFFFLVLLRLLRVLFFFVLFPGFNNYPVPWVSFPRKIDVFFSPGFWHLSKATVTSAPPEVATASLALKSYVTAPILGMSQEVKIKG